MIDWRPVTGFMGARWRDGTTARDLLLILLLGALLAGAGLGLRDPWPADEPRAVLLSRDLVAVGQWAQPAHDIDDDVAPLLSWTLAASQRALGEVRLAFLWPSVLAALGTLLLVHDLGRRVWSREAGLAAALLLACTVQFMLQARVAQAGMLLTLFSTAALYGIGRHLFTGPNWAAYALGGLAAGIGAGISVAGLLPLLLLPPYFALRARGCTGLWRGSGGARWWLAPAGALIGIGVWLAPMLLFVEPVADAMGIMDRIRDALGASVTRLIAPWLEPRPWHQFALQLVLVLWLPGSLLLPWLLSPWRAAWARRQGPPLLLLGWLLLVLGIVGLVPSRPAAAVLPALPALVLAMAPWLLELAVRRAVQQLIFGLATIVALAAAGTALYLTVLRPEHLTLLTERLELPTVAPLAVLAGLLAIVLLALGSGRGAIAWLTTSCLAVLIQGFWINPLLDEGRSGRALIRAVEEITPASAELGLVAYREPQLLHLTRPVTQFGRRRFVDADQQAFDAARWLEAAPGRVLLIDEQARVPCFKASPASEVGRANRREWLLVTRPADPACVAQGDPSAARIYVPPAGLRGGVSEANRATLR